MPPGRNDPCPCGSGRKYKKCCLSGERPTATDAAGPAWTADDRGRAFAQLRRFLNRDELEQARETAFALFWGPLLEPLGDDEHARELLANETSQLAFSYWTMFDFHLDDEERLVERFLGRFPQRLDPGERRWLEAMRDSSVRLWELRDVEPGRGFSAVDAWEGRRVVDVRERSGSKQLVRWDVVAARVVEVADGGHQLEGPCLVLGQREKAPLVKLLRKHWRRIAKQSPGTDEATFFRVLYPLIHDHWVQTVADVSPPRLVTAEGDSFLFSKVVFDVSDRAAVRTALAAHPELEPDQEDDASGRGAETYDWLEAGEPGAPRRGLGRLILAGDRLTLETQSRRRAERGRALIEGIAPAAVRHRATSYEDVHQAIANAPPRSEAEAGSPEIPADVQERMMAEYKDQHYRRWLDESIPALDGRTPREAARLRTARPMLIALLKDLEAMEERAGRAGTPAYDATWMWRELGLRRPRTPRKS